MRASIGSLAVVVGILAAVAAVGIASVGQTAQRADGANVAAVRHHLRQCHTCRESGLSAETLADPARPSPCFLDGRPMMLATD